jgi:DNA-binding MarR family transcriptional regulator
MKQEIEIIDLREKYFRVSNQIFNEDLDIYEVGIYTVLCRFANNDSSESFPSISRLQEMLKVSRPKVIKTLKSLTEKGIIHKKQGNTGFSNRYYLMSLPSKRELLVNEINQPSKPELLGVVTEVNPIKTKVKKTNIKKHRHGDGDNVLLTADEYKILIQEYSAADTLTKINDLSYYIASTGKKYKSHYMTIKAWFRRDKNKPVYNSSYKPNIPKDYTEQFVRMGMPESNYTKAFQLSKEHNIIPSQIYSTKYKYKQAGLL